MLSHILFSYTAAEPVNQSEVAPSDWGKSSIVLLDRRLLMTFWSLVDVWTVGAKPGNEKNVELSVGCKNDGPILAVSGPKFMKFWDHVGDQS